MENSVLIILNKNFVVRDLKLVIAIKPFRPYIESYIEPYIESPPEKIVITIIIYVFSNL